MDNYVLRLVKSKHNDFSKHSNTSHLFYFHNNSGGTSTKEIDYNIGEKIKVGSIYKDGNYLYHVLSKQYDNNNNIILLCKEIN